MSIKNFGRNITFTPKTVYYPKDEQEVLDILNRHHGQRVRVVGKLHSSSEIIRSEQVLLNLRSFDQVEAASEGDSLFAQVGAGCQVKRVLSELKRQKSWTLPSVGLITEQTLVGAISTGTHGSGRNSLSQYVTRVRIARYDQETGQAVIEEIDTGNELLAARCSLGCLGVILSVQVLCREIYSIEEHYQEYPVLDDVLAKEEDFPLQQFYLLPWRWTYLAQHRREADPHKSLFSIFYHWYNYFMIDVGMHVMILFLIRIIRNPKIIRTVIGKVMPLFVLRNKIANDESSALLVMAHDLFRHLEIELFVQRSQLPDALAYLKQVLNIAANTSDLLDEPFKTELKQLNLGESLEKLRGQYCHHYPICVRRVRPDDTLISMASKKEDASASDVCEDWYAVSVITYHAISDRDPFEELARFLAISMAHIFSARPHWGKYCPLTASELRDLYPRFSKFQEICKSHDTDGVFQNNWTAALMNSTPETR